MPGVFSKIFLLLTKLRRSWTEYHEQFGRGAQFGLRSLFCRVRYYGRHLIGLTSLCSTVSALSVVVQVA